MIAITVILAIALLIAFCTSVRLVHNPNTCGDKGICVTLFILLFAIPMNVGEIARGEVSPLPWQALAIQQRFTGFLDASLHVVFLLVFELWAFLIPGHLYATHVAERTGKRPWHPNIINALVGLILCTPWNSIYRVLDWLGPKGQPEY